MSEKKQKKGFKKVLKTFDMTLFWWSKHKTEIKVREMEHVQNH